MKRRKPLERRTPLRKRNPKRQKRRREEGEVYGAYHTWIKGRRCLIGRGCYGPVTGHHLRSVGAGGKDADNEVPLCAGHHVQVETIGPSSFERLYKLDLDLEAANLWGRYCDVTPRE